MKQDCKRCVDRERCLVWAMKKQLPWIEEVTLHEGVIEVKHTYPEGVNISEYIREFIKSREPDATVELQVVRQEP